LEERGGEGAEVVGVERRAGRAGAAPVWCRRTGLRVEESMLVEELGQRG
jgi:hypothetical protein